MASVAMAAMASARRQPTSSRTTEVQPFTLGRQMLINAKLAPMLLDFLLNDEMVSPNIMKDAMAM